MVVARAHGLLWSGSTLALAATLTACGNGSTRTGMLGQGIGKVVGGTSTRATTAPAGAAVKTATMPADHCGWLTVAEVEAVVGKLAGPPRLEDGCRYTIALPDGVKAEREKAIADQARLEAQLKAAYKDYTPARFDGPMANFERDARTYALSLTVAVSGGGTMIGERGEAGTAGGKKVAAGWDAELPFVFYGFGGRVGNVNVVVQGQAPDVPDELARKLAERVRDRIPDLPFPVTNTYQSYDLGSSRSPCSLLTRAEAEAVLGPLVVEPYLTSTDAPGLAHPDGHACAYYTAGHRTFVVSPNWANGATVFKLEKGVGGLMSLVKPQDTLAASGPWDESYISQTTGALMFLKGDGLLTVHYATSSTDRAGATALATRAMRRLAS